MSKRRKVATTENVSSGQDNEDITARFHVAVKNGHLGVVHDLVGQSSRLVHTTDETGCTPLYNAAGYGQLSMARFLSSKAGANANQASANSLTPLYIAAKHGHLHLVRYLIEEAGATMVETYTPLYAAACRGDVEIVRYLAGTASASVDAISTLFEETAVFGAVRAGHLDVVRYLVDEAAANVNIGDLDGTTPLCAAIKLKGHLEIVRYLACEVGADGNKCVNGMTPLHLAARGGHLETVRLLVEQAKGPAMVDVNKLSKRGYTPLHLAVLGAHLEIVRYLAEEAGASVHTPVTPVVQREGRLCRRLLPLHTAICNGQLPMVQYLLSVKGAPVNLFDPSIGLVPPLLLALKSNGMFALQIIRCVVLAGAMFVGPQTFDEFAPSPHLLKSALYESVKERDLLATTNSLKGLLPSCVCSIVGEYTAPNGWGDVLARLVRT
jgi:ankyrin